MQIKLPFEVKLPTDIEKLVRIVRAELGPDALPVSRSLLAACLAAYALGLSINLLLYKTPLQALGIALAGALLLALVSAGSLYLLGYGKRLPQTLTALAGTGTIVALVSFVVRSVILIGLPEEVPTEDLARFLMFPLFLWNILIFTGIYRSAFSGRMIPAIAVAVAYLVMLEFLLPRYFQ